MTFPTSNITQTKSFPIKCKEVFKHPLPRHYALFSLLNKHIHPNYAHIYCFNRSLSLTQMFVNPRSTKVLICQTVPQSVYVIFVCNLHRLTPRAVWNHKDNTPNRATFVGPRKVRICHTVLNVGEIFFFC